MFWLQENLISMKKSSTAQSFIRKEVTSYKIHPLVTQTILKEKVLPLVFLPKWGTFVTLTPPGFDGPDKINNYTTSKHNSTMADFETF